MFASLYGERDSTFVDVYENRVDQKEIHTRQHKDTYYLFSIPHILWLFLYLACSCSFKSIALFTFSAQLPYNTRWSVLTICTRICTCLTIIQAFLTIPNTHFLTSNHCLSFGVITAFHTSVTLPDLHNPLKFIISYPVGLRRLFCNINFKINAVSRSEAYFFKKW